MSDSDQEMVIPLHVTKNITLQWFLLEDDNGVPLGVCEVGTQLLQNSADGKLYRLICTCPKWTPDGDTCVHAEEVASRILGDEYMRYPAPVSMPIANTNLKAASMDAVLMRHWLLHHGKPMVL